MLVDELDGYFDPASEPFTLILARDLEIPDFQTMTFRYTILELNTAIKPFFLEYLFTHCGCQQLCYFDPDITINHPLDEIFNLLETKLMVLTPHLLDFLEDDFLPDEPYILRSGVYNLGFIGVAQHPELSRFLHWWQRRLKEMCVVDTARGLFTDQRWMDLAPGFFDDVYIHRDPGCDVAYWNLNHRQLEKVGQAYTVNGVPLKFFHFSGFMVENSEPVSKHQNRYTLSDIPYLRPIYETYRQQLIEQGYYGVKDWPYAYNDFYFDNGLKVPEIVRLIWRQQEEKKPGRWSNPLATGVEDSFLCWLNQPVDRVVGQPSITNLALSIYDMRADLQTVFPDPTGTHRLAFADWFVRSAAQDHRLDYDIFVKPVADSIAHMYEARLTTFQNQLNDREADLAALRIELGSREADLAALRAELGDREVNLAALRTELSDREADLAAIYGSRAWKIVRKLQQLYRGLTNA